MRANFLFSVAGGLSVLAAFLVIILRTLQLDTYNVERDIIRRRIGVVSSANQLDDLVEAYPSNVDVHLAWCESVARDGMNMEETERRLMIFRTKFPRHCYGIDKFSRILIGKGEYGAADSFIMSCLKLPLTKEHKHLLYRNYALSAETSGDHASAILRWERTMRTFAPNPEDLERQSKVWVKLGQVLKAEQCLKRALHLQPGHRESLRQFALAAVLNKDWTEAAIRWKRYREIFDHAPDGYLREAEALLACGRISEMMSVLNSASYIFSSNEDVRSTAAALLSKVSRAEFVQSGAPNDAVE